MHNFMTMQDQVEWILFFMFLGAWCTLPIVAGWMWWRLHKYLKQREEAELAARVRRSNPPAFTTPKRF